MDLERSLEEWLGLPRELQNAIFDLFINDREAASFPLSKYAVRYKSIFNIFQVRS
jgi:hypothetical protein